MLLSSDSIIRKTEGQMALDLPAETLSKNTILIVDDNDLNCEILSIIFSAHPVLVASNGVQALKLIREKEDTLSAVLLDYIMPEMDGLAFLKRVKEEKLLSNTPIFLITSEEDDTLAAQAFKLGVVDFIKRPLSAFIVQKRVESIIELYRNRMILEELLIKETRKVEAFGHGLIKMLGAAIEDRVKDSKLHRENVKALVSILLTKSEVGNTLSAQEISEILEAISLQDIGKLSQDSALHKDLDHPNKAQQIEISERNQKAILMLKDLQEVSQFKPFQFARDIAEFQQETQEGHRFAEKIGGQEIPLWIQGVAFASLIDSVIANSGKSGEKAFAEALKRVEEGEFGKFNPSLLKAVKENLNELQAVYA